MAPLMPRNDRINLGIDTIPRSIVWSALLLLKCTKVLNTSNFPYTNSIKIGIDKEVIEIQATLPYNRETLINRNGDIISAILPITGLNPYTGIQSVTPSREVYLPLPDNDDSRVDSLEKFFVWCCQYYKTGLYRYTDEGRNISVLFFDEKIINGYPSVVVRAILPYSYTVYSCTGSLVGAVYELFSASPCAEGVLAIGAGYMLLFEGEVLVVLGLVS